ncbi:MAG: Ig-like domain-containing protein [Luteolibacter sp.]|uniref:tandem-95 repeat protein n=1 Tax=Luteolibacter sp. TaxID=1962973 RepID=UPI0032645E49
MMRLAGLVGSLVLSAPTVAYGEGEVPPVRIMPLGDSITQGFGSEGGVEGGYRNGLYSLLTTAGYTVDFVGSRSDLNNPSLPDVDHQGVPGARIEDLRNQMGVWLKETEDPDVVLLEIGTNDFSAGEGVAQTQDQLKSLIASLSASRPYTKIIVASLLPRTDSVGIQTLQAEFNASLPGIVAEQVALGRQVSFLDMNSALGAADLSDGVHPNLAGYGKMAECWLPAVTAAISPLGTSSPPAIARLDSRTDLTHLTVKFSKPLDDSAAAVGNFSLSSGVSVLQAELDSVSKRVVTLTTSPQAPGTLYVLSVQGVRDRTPQQNLILPDTTREFTSRTLIDGSFESYGQGWSFSGNNSVVGSPLPATDGTKLMVFNGAESAPDGVVSQVVETIPGEKYKLGFDMGVNGSSALQSLNVKVTGNFPLLSQTEQLSGPGGGATQWANKDFEFVANSLTTTVTFEDKSATTNSVDLLLDDVRMNLEITPTLTVTSSPYVGASVTVTPVDLNSNGNGDTNFTRTYNEGASVNLTAPPTSGGLNFEEWQKDGLFYSASTAISLTMDANHTLKAVYSLLNNGSFELGTPDGNGIVTNVTSWTTSGEVFGYVENAPYSKTDGARLLVFNGPSSVPSGVASQSFPTISGQTYTVEFDMGVVGTVQQQVQVALTGAASLLTVTDSATGNNALASTWQYKKSHDFVADSATTVLTFTDVSSTAASVDLLLDRVRVYLKEANTVPTAVNDTYVATQSTPLVVAASGVLVNDTDPQFNPLTAVLNVGPAHGSVTLNGNGGFTYTPTGGYTGPDSFAYHANDGALDSNIATVTITVNPPVANLVANGSFELGTADGNGVVADVTNWTESGNCFGYVTSGAYTATDPSRLMVFNGGTATPNGTIFQSFATTPGQAYLLAFDMGVVGTSGQSQQLAVTVTGAGTLLSETDSATGSGVSASAWSAKSHYFVANSATTTLTFTDVSSNINFVDLLLDNVRVTSSANQVLSVTSSPTSGASVIVTPADLNGVSSGDTAFNRVYANGASVNLTAPLTHGGTAFVKWQKNGVDYSTNAGISVTMDGNHALNAVYLPGNTAPVAVADSYSVNQDTPLVVVAPGLLANDTDGQMDSLTAVANVGPSHGNLNLNSNGGFIYTPAPGYAGPDSFTYHANDGLLNSNTVMVSLTVNAAGANILVNGSFESDMFGWTATGSQFAYTSDGTYVATDPVKMAVFNGGQQPVSGVISQTFATTPGQSYMLTFDMGAGGPFAGVMEFAVTVTGGTSLLSVTDSATGTGIGISQWESKTHSFVADGTSATLTFTDVSVSGHFIDLLLDNVKVVASANSTLTVTSSPVTGINVVVSPTDLGLSGDGVTNFIRTYTPGATVSLTAPLASGPADFVKWQKNGVDYSNDANVSVTMDGSHTMNAVYLVNAAPFAVADSYSTTQNVQLSVSAPGVKGNDTDAEMSPLTVHLNDGPANGDLTLNSDGSFTYLPDSNYLGTDSFTYHVNDGELDSAVATVTITIQAPNLIANGSFEQDSPANFAPIPVWVVNESVPGAAVIYNNDGTYTSTDGTHMALFNSVNKAFGSTISQSFETEAGKAYQLNFDTGIVGQQGRRQSLRTTVNGNALLLSQTVFLNAGPAAALWGSLSYTFVADSASTTLIFHDNSADPETGDATNCDLLLDHVTVNEISNTRTLVVTSTPTAGLGVTVAPADLAGSSNGPTPFSRTYSFGTTVTLTATATSGPKVFQKWQKNGVDVTPAGLTTSVLVDDNHTMNAVYVIDNSPRAAADSYPATEDTLLTVVAPGVLTNDEEPNTLGMTAVLDATTSHGVLALNPDGSFTYDPAADFNGTDTFTYHATNGSLNSATTTVTLTVAATNDPSAATPQTLVTAEDTPLAITLAGTDIDGDVLLFANTNPSHGTLSGTAPNLTYTPTLNYNGPDSFTFTVNDGSGPTAPATVSITVSAVPDPPVANGQSLTMTGGTVLPLVLTGTDADGDAITYSIVTAPAQGSLSGTPPNLTYYPVSTFTGSDSFTFKANDGTADSAPATVSITINGVLKNGSFETVSGSPSVPTFWTTSGNFVIKTGTASLPSTHPTTTSKMVSFNDTNAAANGVFSQTFATTPGRPYNLLFSLGAYAGTFQHRLRVMLTDSSSVRIKPDEDFPITGPGGVSYLWTEKSTSFVANSNTTTLQFLDVPLTSAVNNNSDLLLDNVRLEPQLTHTLTVASLPDPGVNVTVSPADSNSKGNGVTGFSRIYLASPLVSLSVPAAIGAMNFQKWQLNGVDFAVTPATSVTMSADYHMTAVYIPNAPPVAVADSYSTDEDVPLVVPAAGVLSNDTDSELVALTAVLDVGPTHGTLTLNPTTGAFNYTPTANYFGSDSFTYHAFDGVVSSSITTVTLTINPVNDAPVAVADSGATNEDAALVVAAPGVLSNDTDVEPGTLTAVLDVGPLSGMLVLHADGSYDYTPVANFNGVVTFTYHASDGNLSSNIVTVTLTVNPVNDAPVAAADSGTTDEDIALVVAAPGVLSNDTDLDGNSLTAVLNAGPAHGTLTLNPDGGYTYTPTANYFGSDSFTYHAFDGVANSAIVAVSLTVNSINDAPVAVADSSATDEDSILQVAAPGVLGNDTDVEPGILTAVLDAGPSSGTLVLRADGSYDYTPAANFHGVASFTYHATDGTWDSNVATVTITVDAINDAPVAAADTGTTDEDTVLQVAIPGVLSNDSDLDGDSITSVLDVAPASGTLVLHADGSYDYTPAENFHGVASFTYHATDGNLTSNVATVTITVNSINDAPVAVADSSATDEDTVLNVAAPGVLSNDSDLDGDAFTAVLDIAPASGTLVLHADGSYDYTPAANFHGVETFAYHATDGTLDSNVATVTITVNPINDAPVATADSGATDEDTILNVVAPGVLSNDTDLDGDSLTAVLDVAPANGTLLLRADGSYDYTPAANFHGQSIFTYHATDGNLDSNVMTVTITVNPINDAPVAVADSGTTDEDTVLHVVAPGVLANDNDFDGDTFTAVLDAGPSSGTLVLQSDGSYDYTPAANFHGVAGFTYHATDGTLDSNVVTVTITVSPINDAPVAAADSGTTDEDTVLHVVAPGVLANDNDLDGDTFTAVLDVGPSSGTLVLQADGSYDYTPAANFHGVASFTYHTTDGTLDSNIVTVTITVNSINDAPVAVADSETTDEDIMLQVAAPGVLANDSDLDGDSLTAVLDVAPTSGTLVLQADGSYDYTPAANFHGVATFTYHATDGTLDSNVATVTIIVNSINDAPVAVADSGTTDEDIMLQVAAPGVLANDSDLDGDAFTAVLDVGPSSGTLALNPDGGYDYTPAANFHGQATFTYHATDGTLDSNVATVTITVNSINDAPVAAADSSTTDEDILLQVAAPGVLANDSDLDGDAITAVLDVAPTGGTLVLHADGGYDYTPAVNFHGVVSFTYHATDGNLNSNVATVTITVNSINDAPTALADSGTTDEDAILHVAAPGVLSDDTDLDGDSLMAVLDIAPTSGTLVLHADGSYDYTPAANFHGVATFTYHATDGNLTSNVATVTITINPINDAPVAVADSGTTDEDTVLHVVASGILANDSDLDGDPLTAVLDVGPSSGTLVLQADGSYDYTPAANFHGVASFTYHTTDGNLDSNVVTVTITVSPINDAPVAAADSGTTDEDTVLHVSAPGVIANDSDLEGDTFTAVLEVGPSSGTLALNPDGSYDYTPAANFYGIATFTYHVTDGTLNSNIATVTLTVNSINDAPVAAADSGTTNEDTALVVAAPGVLSNDTDLDGDTFTAVLNAGPAHGTLTLNPNGGYTYTPAANYSGSDSFTYHATDGNLNSNIMTVTLTVNSVIDDGFANWLAGYGLVGNPGEDPDHDGISNAVEFVIGGDPKSQSNANWLPTVSLANPAPNENLPNKSYLLFTYRRTDLAKGDDRTSIRVDWSADFAAWTNTQGTSGVLVVEGNDEAAPGVDLVKVYIPLSLSANGKLFARLVVSIDVPSVNNAPVALAQNLSANEDIPLPVTLAATDSNNDVLTYSVAGNPLHGTLTGTVPNLIYTPSANYSGPDSFTFIANDGAVSSASATVSITVNPVNDVPVANAQSVNVNEDNSLAITLSGSDVETSSLNFVEIGTPLHGNLTGTPPNVTYHPVANYYGADSFTFKVNDGASDSLAATVSITVNSINDVPVAFAQSVSLNEDSTLAITLVGNDVETSSLNFVEIGTPLHGNLTGTPPNLTYHPVANYNGPDSFTFKVNDGAASSTAATVSITVNSVIDDSFASWLAGYGLVGNPGDDPDHDGISNAVEFVIGGDPKNQSNVNWLPTVSLANPAPNENLPNKNYLLFTYRRTDLAKADEKTSIRVDWSTNFSIWTNTQGTLGVIVVEGNDEAGPGVDLVKVYIPRLLANQGSLFARFVVSIDVPHVNNAPVAQSQNLSVNQGVSLPVTLAANDSENDPMTYAVSNGPIHGTLSGSGANQIYTPAANYSGPDSFTFVANDGIATSLPGTISITVNAVNQFNQWMSSYGLSASPGADSDKDSISNAVEYVIGGNPANQSDAAFLPTVSLANPPPNENFPNKDYLLFTYRRTDLANTDPSTTIKVEWNTDFVGSWTNAQGAPGVVIVPSNDAAAPGVDLVKVYIPRSLAVNGRIFARLNVVISVP